MINNEDFEKLLNEGTYKELLIENSFGAMTVIIVSPDEFAEMEEVCERIIENGIYTEVNNETGQMICMDMDHNQEHFPDLVGQDVTNLIAITSKIGQEKGFNLGIDVLNNGKRMPRLLN